MRSWLALLAATSALSCSLDPSAPATGGAPAAPPPAKEAKAPTEAAPAEAVESASDSASDAGSTTGGDACAGDMALVEGRYCLTPEHRCVSHQDIVTDHGVEPNQCTRYAEPVVCFDERRKPLRFCMDRYEWPNEKGVKPKTLVSWPSARELCAEKGKRLCTEEEFNFACEGEAMRPYVYGFSRDATQCNFDKPYRPRTFKFTPFDVCMQDEACRAAYEAIDQRTPAGSIETCRSPEGIYDLNGNANEWVILPGAKSPHRSGLKGGWWGPVRDRCRPTVTFHDEGDFGYEVGFRCCSDPASG